MELSKIKIAGFKSFVDPVTIDVPSKLTAIVGPNGCGKSNIIDAVTWVMGESSPKYLRGESLTDVIFNGSSARKPVGQASVELIFDNHDGAIGGEYAKFAEISIRRQLNRDSDAAYYLNGVRCRKRDVVDIFLGTGLGPRSYSIIGQNMISRVIEAKPDELRVYLEEAAGISKYKERRHETNLRIQHTKDNLARVNDVHAELVKQLSHLKHQADVAEKFKILKEQERLLRAEVCAIKWRELDVQMVESTLRIQREETSLEARQSELLTTDNEIEHIRNEQRAAQDAFQEVQRRYYAVGNEITRHEQDILHAEEREQQWKNDLKQADKDWQSFKDQLSQTEDESIDLTHEIERLTPEYAAMTEAVQSLNLSLKKAEETMQVDQQQFDDFTQLSARTGQVAQVEKMRIQQIEQKIAFLQKRQEQLKQDQQKYNFETLNHEIADYAERSTEVSAQLEAAQQALGELRIELNTVQSRERETNHALDQHRSQLQQLRGQEASLQALQQTALGQRDNPAGPWITRYQLQTKPRLAKQIQVEAGWELAVEKALDYGLQAICVDEFSEVVPHLQDFKSGKLCIFKPDALQSVSSDAAKGTLLLDKINAPWPLNDLLGGIYIADDMETALSLCKKLAANESVITREGVWLSRSWIRLLREEDAAAGVFQRETVLNEMAAKIKQLEQEQAQLDGQLSAYREQIKALEQKRETLQQHYNQHQSQSAQIRAQHKAKQDRFTELKIQSERLIKDQEESQHQLKQAHDELNQSRLVFDKAMRELDEQGIERESITKNRDETRRQLQTMRENSRAQQERLNEIEIRLQTARSQKTTLNQMTLRLETQLHSLSKRKMGLQTELDGMPKMEALKAVLSQALDKHVSVEVEMNTARHAVDALDQEFHRLEEKRQTIEREANKLKSILEKLRVELEGWKVKSDTLLSQLKETDFTLEAILQQLPIEATAEAHQVKFEQVVQRINRLGPINLVAIEEYATCSERKSYLDKQIEDLQSGLAILEEAIAKIDKETRIKFKETFDKVNERFQELFPTIFGGGKAYLELTSDSLLEAGVTLMACPPGKRNSSIHLLSGGEKSLTAIALIFSIFHLNPAPFCLLDEVDAALDDANVLRFTRLVKAMTEKTQFLFISHNKITIEMGEQLIGVTMNEPGVSRLVSVDIDKAIALAST